MRRLRFFAVPLVALLLLVGGCNKSGNTAANAGGSPSVATAASCPTSNTTDFAKTKFALHLGLAAGTFHRYIWKPYREGKFTKGAHGRIFALIKAGATGLFDEHEIRKAIEDVKASPTLCRALIAPLSKIGNAFANVKSSLKGGDVSSLGSIQSALGGAMSLSGSHGVPITESTDQSKG